MPHRMLVRPVVLLGLLLFAFLGTVTTLNLTLYSAPGFVSSYLDAIARGDVDGARRMPGVTAGAIGTDELLAPAALAPLSDIRLIRDRDDGGGRHTVLYGYTVGGSAGTSAFVVERSGVRLGVFSAWRFVDSPLSLLRVTVRNGGPGGANGIAANGVTLLDTTPGRPHAYRVLTPSRVVLSHASRYLTGAKVATLVSKPASFAEATLDIQPNRAFVREVQKEVDGFLAACTAQKVLLPTGCPMGKQITDRIQDAPAWSIVKYPVVTIVPGDAAGSWQVPETGALAHLRVTVKSIFDGSLSTFDEDVPFAVRYLITFAADGSPVVAAQFD
ncbi:MAG: hypothetical protein V4531_05935 [Actinomycetota bacterium]